LISIDRLIKGELQHSQSDAVALPNVLSENGDWFPDGIAAISPVNHLEMASDLNEAISRLPLNRKGRRMAKRKAFKRNKLRPEMIRTMVANARSQPLNEVLKKYPMRQEDARILYRYTVGDATLEESEEAFLNSLRDPRWMMQWFSENHEQLSPFIEWTRDPAASMVKGIDLLVRYVTKQREEDADEKASQISYIQWKGWQNELLVGVAQTASQQLNINGSLTSEQIDSKCPGLSVGIRSLHEAWWSITSRSPRPPVANDVLDCMHAMYAPYVDVFRADKFMAPHVDKFSKRFGCAVVSKLIDLPMAIEHAIAKREASAS